MSNEVMSNEEFIAKAKEEAKESNRKIAKAQSDWDAFKKKMMK